MQHSATQCGGGGLLLLCPINWDLLRNFRRTLFRYCQSIRGMHSFYWFFDKMNWKPVFLLCMNCYCADIVPLQNCFRNFRRTWLPCCRNIHRMTFSLLFFSTASDWFLREDQCFFVDELLLGCYRAARDCAFCSLFFCLLRLMNYGAQLKPYMALILIQSILCSTAQKFRILTSTILFPEFTPKPHLPRPRSKTERCFDYTEEATQLIWAPSSKSRKSDVQWAWPAHSLSEAFVTPALAASFEFIDPSASIQFHNEISCTYIYAEKKLINM